MKHKRPGKQVVEFDSKTNFKVVIFFFFQYNDQGTVGGKQGKNNTLLSELNSLENSL